MEYESRKKTFFETAGRVDCFSCRPAEPEQERQPDGDRNLRGRYAEQRLRAIFYADVHLHPAISHHHKFCCESSDAMTFSIALRHGITVQINPQHKMSNSYPRNHFLKITPKNSSMSAHDFLSAFSL